MDDEDQDEAEFDLAMQDTPAHLPQVIAELIEVAGSDAAWTLVQAKGGQTVFIPAEVNQGHWLSRLVGHEAAKKIAEHYRGGNSGHSLTVPLARLYQSKIAMVKALRAGATANEAAAAAGMHVRSAHRARARLRARFNANQFHLFEDDD